jgi:hypothetical protein
MFFTLIRPVLKSNECGFAMDFFDRQCVIFAVNSSAINPKITRSISE